MQTKEFLAKLDHARITKAITAAELTTSGEIRVFVARRAADDPVRRAEAEFVRLGMHKTQSRNAVLLYVAPVSRCFAIIGDRGIHEKCGQGFWGGVAEAMRADFVAADFTRGVERGIEESARQLAQHFPRAADDRNELSNDIVED